MKKKLDKDNSFSLMEVLWRIVAPLVVAVLRLLWNEYGDKIITWLRWAFIE